MTLRKAFVLAVFVLVPGNLIAQRAQQVGIGYPNGASNWPIFIAKEGGYYKKYGLEVKLAFSPHPTGIAMLVNGEVQFINYALEQMMLASTADSSLRIVSSISNRGMFALIADRSIRSVGDLRGKRIAIGQFGDASQSFVSSAISRAGLTSRDVQWLPTGSDLSARVAALVTGRADAALLTAPAFFRVENQRFGSLINFAEESGVFAATALVVKHELMVTRPDLVTAVIKAHSEATKRFYEDRRFAVETYRKYDTGASEQDLERLYDLYAEAHAFERVPFVQGAAITRTISQQSNPSIVKQLNGVEFGEVVNNDFVAELIMTRFFESLYGPSIVPEIEKQRRAAFRLR